MSMFSEIAPLAAFFLVHQAYGLYAAAASGHCRVQPIGGGHMGIRKTLGALCHFRYLHCRFIDLGGDYGRGKTYIKIQPSLFSGAFAAVLLIGRLRGRAMMKVFFQAQFDLPEKVWNSLSLRWGLFFLWPPL